MNETTRMMVFSYNYFKDGNNTSLINGIKRHVKNWDLGKFFAEMESELLINKEQMDDQCFFLGCTL